MQRYYRKQERNKKQLTGKIPALIAFNFGFMASYLESEATCTSKPVKGNIFIRLKAALMKIIVLWERAHFHKPTKNLHPTLQLLFSSMERFSSFQLIVSAVIELVAPGSTSQGTKRFLHPVVESTTP